MNGKVDIISPRKFKFDLGCCINGVEVDLVKSKTLRRNAADRMNSGIFKRSRAWKYRRNLPEVADCLQSENGQLISQSRHARRMPLCFVMPLSFRQESMGSIRVPDHP